MDSAISPRVLRPDSEAALAEALRDATSARASAAIRGGGTHDGSGKFEAVDRVIETGAYAGIEWHAPREMTVAVRAGTPMSELRRTLRSAGQWLPIEAPESERSTIGGIVSADASGLTRARYGSTKAWILGMRLAMTDGAVIHSGSSVVKSVAGYDLHRLFVGGRGAFGAVLECVFKVGLLPEGRETLVFLADDLSKLAPLREELMALGPSAVALSRADGVMRLIVSFDGFREDAQASLDRLSLIMNPLKRVEHETLAADQIGEGGTSILRTVQHEWLPGPLHHAFGVPASRALDVVEALDARIPFLADLASGRIDARGDASDFIAAADRARSAGGWATVRGAIAADGTNALRARIKRAFDPNEVLRA